MTPSSFDPARQAVLFAPERQAMLPRPDIVRFAQIDPGITVADLGCGNGYLLGPLSVAVGPAGRVLGSDIQPAMLEGAIAHVASEGLTNVTLAPSGEVAIPVPDGSCDRAIICQVWHDLADPVAYLGEVRRILKQDGELIIVNWEPIWTGIGPRVFRRWSVLRTMSLLGEAGWTLLRARSLTWANYAIAAGPPEA